MVRRFVSIPEKAYPIKDWKGLILPATMCMTDDGRYFKNDEGLVEEVTHLQLQIQHSENELKIYYVDTETGELEPGDWLVHILSDHDGFVNGSEHHWMTDDILILTTEYKQGNHMAYLNTAYYKESVMFYYTIDLIDTHKMLQENYIPTGIITADPIRAQINDQIILDL